MSIISIPKALREKLGEEGSDALIDIINRAQGDKKTDVIRLVGEKFERRLSEEIAGVNHRMERLRVELKEDNANLRAELKADNANIRADLIKWMFIFWVGQVAAILGILFAFFR